MDLSLDDETYTATKEVKVKLSAKFLGPDTAIGGDTYSGSVVNPVSNSPLVGLKVLVNGVHLATTGADGSFSFTVPMNI